MVSLFVIHLVSLFCSVFNWVQENLSYHLHVLLSENALLFVSYFSMVFNVPAELIAFPKNNVGFLETLSFNFSQAYHPYFT